MLRNLTMTRAIVALFTLAIVALLTGMDWLLYAAFVLFVISLYVLPRTTGRRSGR